MSTTLRKLLRRYPENVVATIVCNLEGEFGLELRQRWWRARLRHMGRDVRIEAGATIRNPHEVVLGDRAWIDRGVILLAGADQSQRRRTTLDGSGAVRRGELLIGANAHIAPWVIVSAIGGVRIGDDCGVATGSALYSLSHGFCDPDDPARRDAVFTPRAPHDRQYMVEGPIELGDNVGLATGTTLLPGTLIGNDSFVLGGAVVRGSFPDNSLIAGVPARRLRDRFA